MAEVLTFENVFRDPTVIFGKWKEFFGNDNDIVLEVGCGRGEYVIGLSEVYPERNFVGLEMKGSRIWPGAKKMLAEERKNVSFINTMVKNVFDFFGEGELSEIWVTFPDPQPKPCRAMKRLISPRHLEMYKKLLKKGGKLHFKTDNTMLFDYGVEVVGADKDFEVEVVEYDLYSTEDRADLAEAKLVQTYYEGKFSALGEKIKYLRAKI